MLIFGSDPSMSEFIVFLGELLYDVFTLHYWRFSICLSVSILLAMVVYDRIAADPLRWMVAGAIVIAGAVVGSNWERNS